MFRFRCCRFLVAALSLLISLSPLPAQQGRLISIAHMTAGFQRFEGFVPFFLDARTGHVFLELGRFNQEFLYVASLRSGLGSNAIGLDRSRLAGSRVVFWKRVGLKVLLVQKNLRFRALGAPPAEQRAVGESFAGAVLAGFQAVAASGEQLLVDATAFLLGDQAHIAASLRRAGQGNYQIDKQRSVLIPEALRGFPKNSELEALLTFTASKPGVEVARVAADPRAVMLRLHHSFIELPGPGYTPRPFQPRCGYFPESFLNFAAPLEKPLKTLWIQRHRLHKLNPGSAPSKAKQPIIYYVDRGVPEPVRSALVTGASWWAQAFEAAGFLDAFQVKLLPQGADPLDVRYNVIQWVHRATRGWSYGSSVVDPRTGEIIKGHVLLGSQRVRRDMLLMSGLATNERAGFGSCDAGAGAALLEAPLLSFLPPAQRLKVVLARIRQLTAHEVGHTLGLTHNFAASVDGRASVMDYPAPLVALKQGGGLDLSEAYAVGVGAWDKLAIRYGYTEFPPGSNEKEQLQSIVAAGIKAGLHFLDDRDGRSFTSADPDGAVWDNGPDPALALRHALHVRRWALHHFGLANLAAGEPLARLEELLVPLYLYHRYALDRASKALGGVRYGYASKEDGQPPLTPVPSREQRAALSALLDGLRPSALRLPTDLMKLLAPPAPGFRRGRESFQSATGAPFDLLGAAGAAAQLVITRILAPARLARVEQFSLSDGSLPDLAEVLRRLVETVFVEDPGTDDLEAAISRRVETLLVAALIALAQDPRATPGTRSAVHQVLVLIEAKLNSWPHREDPREAPHRVLLTQTLTRFYHRPYQKKSAPRPPEVPPGSPIGR